MAFKWKCLSAANHLILRTVRATVQKKVDTSVFRARPPLPAGTEAAVPRTITDAFAGGLLSRIPSRNYWVLGVLSSRNGFIVPRHAARSGLDSAPMMKRFGWDSRPAPRSGVAAFVVVAAVVVARGARTIAPAEPKARPWRGGRGRAMPAQRGATERPAGSEPRAHLRGARAASPRERRRAEHGRGQGTSGTTATCRSRPPPQAGPGGPERSEDRTEAPEAARRLKAAVAAAGRRAKRRACTAMDGGFIRPTTCGRGRGVRREHGCGGHHRRTRAEGAHHTFSFARVVAIRPSGPVSNRRRG